MGERIEIDTANGSISAWRAMPDGRPRGGVVVIQEIFGVNAHIRSVTERFATHGYAAIAPALFDPVEREVELGYDAAGIARGRELVAAVGFDGALDSVGAAANALRKELEILLTQAKDLETEDWKRKSEYFQDIYLNYVTKLTEKMGGAPKK